jgi:hypothetical protein
MKYLIATLLVFVPLHPASADSRQLTSENSALIIRKNADDSNAVVITPDKDSIGILFPEETPISLILPPNNKYTIGIEYLPKPADLAWITFSDNSGFLDCVVVSQQKTISFATSDIIDLLRKNEVMFKEGSEVFTREVNQQIKND